MIQDAVFTKLKTSSLILSTVSTFQGQPAIFPDFAPEGKQYPYIVFIVYEDTSDDEIIKEFTLEIHFFDNSQTGKLSRQIGTELRKLFIQAEFFDSNEYSSIRCWGRPFEMYDEKDPRQIHAIQEFEVRACNKGWIDNLTGA